jgi:hypothetical protein
MLTFSGFAQDKNPFDVFRTDSDIDSIVVSEMADTIDVTKIEGANPFDISHLPIRKNQYKEIEQLTLRNNVVKETISIAYKPLWSLICSLCILAFIIFRDKDHVVSLIKSLFNENYLRLMNYESNGGKNAIYFLGYVLFLSNVTLFVYLILTNLYNIDISNLYYKLLAAAILFFVGKHIVLKIISWILNTTKERELYDFKLISDYNVLALFFLSLNILVIFGPEIWLKTLSIIAFICFFMFLLQRYYRGIRIAKYYLGRYFFHFFIYFCAFEFTPWLVVIKLVKNLF